MRAYLVTCGKYQRLAGTNADARALKKDLLETTGLKKSEATIAEHEVPTPKAELIQYINRLHEDYAPLPTGSADRD